jgi:hypothetical protein
MGFSRQQIGPPWWFRVFAVNWLFDAAVYEAYENQTYLKHQSRASVVAIDHSYNKEVSIEAR